MCLYLREEKVSRLREKKKYILVCLTAVVFVRSQGLPARVVRSESAICRQDDIRIQHAVVHAIRPA